MSFIVIYVYRQIHIFEENNHIRQDSLQFEFNKETLLHLVKYIYMIRNTIYFILGILCTIYILSLPIRYMYFCLF